MLTSAILLIFAAGFLWLAVKAAGAFASYIRSSPSSVSTLKEIDIGRVFEAWLLGGAALGSSVAAMLCAAFALGFAD
jgi:hypothetical protein